MRKTNPAWLFAVLLLLVPAFSFALGYPVNTAQLKALEAKDSFPVRVIQKNLRFGYYATNIQNRDCLTLTICNDSDRTVTSVDVDILVYQKYKRPGTGIDAFSNMTFGIASEGTGDVPADMSADLSSPHNLTHKRGISYHHVALTIRPGGTSIVDIECDASAFDGARTMVECYTTEDGETADNPLMPEWNELALGSPTHVLYDAAREP